MLELLSGGSVLLFLFGHFSNRPVLANVGQASVVFLLFFQSVDRISVPFVPKSVCIGVLFGVMSGWGSFILTLRDGFSISLNTIRKGSFLMRNALFRKQILTQGATAFWEEILWRVCVQGLFQSLLSGHLSIVLTSLLFWSVHDETFQGCKHRMVDLFIFSIWIGFLFEHTGDIVVCILMHFVRNMMVVGYHLTARQ